MQTVAAVIEYNVLAQMFEWGGTSKDTVNVLSMVCVCVCVYRGGSPQWRAARGGRDSAVDLVTRILVYT